MKNILKLLKEEDILLRRNEICQYANMLICQCANFLFLPSLAILSFGEGRG